MTNQISKRTATALAGVYRKFTTPPPPNLVGDREVEYAWICARIPSGPGAALEFGCGHSYLSLVAAERGFISTALDLLSVSWNYTHPALRFVQGDILRMTWEPSSIDLILNCSVVEHVGLGRYGDDTESNGDIAAMAALRRLLRPNGRMLMTLPVGRDAVVTPHHRIYGPQRLPRLLYGFRVEEAAFWVKDDLNRWVMTTESVALDQPGGPTRYNLGCFVLLPAS
jgi:SAM-dependent methyltransferase